MKKGADFEALMNPRVRSELSKIGADINGTTQIDQLYVLGPKGNMVIFDNGFVKEVKNELGEVLYIKVVYNDSKYSNAAGWTDNQKTEIIDFFKNNPDKYIVMKVRTSPDKLINTPISQGSEIRLYRQDVYKTISDGNGNFGQTIKMDNINFIDK